MRSIPIWQRWWPTTHVGYVWLCIVIISFTTIGNAGRWNRSDVLTSDTGGYYAYLASKFITNDLGDATYLAAVRASYRSDLEKDYGNVHLPNGKTVFKYPMGMAIAYAPWFGLAHGYARLHGDAPDGYSKPYQCLVALGCLVYALVGLWLLGIELRRYFADHIAALTLLVLGLGTNLYCYDTYEATMPHATLFLLNVLLLRYTRKWYTEGTWRAGLALATVFGLMLLTRPSELWMVAVPVLWGLSSRAAVQQRAAYWLAHWPQLAAMAATVVLVAGMQFVFWRVVGGYWFLDFYPGEKFDFLHPHILQGLFSVRKGWLFWTPLMAFALLGIVWTRRYVAQALPVLVVLVPVVVYATYSWWDWGYGGSFSARPLISIYPLLSFSLASFWARWWPRYAWPLAVVVLALVLLNILQSWQYFLGMVNCCNMTWEMYKEFFFALQWPNPGT